MSLSIGNQSWNSEQWLTCLKSADRTEELTDLFPFLVQDVANELHSSKHKKLKEIQQIFSLTLSSQPSQNLSQLKLATFYTAQELVEGLSYAVEGYLATSNGKNNIKILKDANFSDICKLIDQEIKEGHMEEAKQMFACMARRVLQKTIKMKPFAELEIAPPAFLQKTSNWVTSLGMLNRVFNEEKPTV
jgi:hypothetical protein